VVFTQFDESKMSLTKVSYSMINGAYLNVLDYGAYNDGTNATITTAAIQAAIDDLGLAGGVLYFPVGTYAINSTITTPSDSYGIWLLGSGLRTTFLQWTGGASPMIVGHQGTDNFTVQAFALANSGSGTVAIQLNGVRSQVQDVFTNAAVAFSDSVISTTQATPLYNYKVIFDNVNLFCSDNGAGQGDIGIRLGSGHSVTIQNSMFSGFASAAVYRDIADGSALNGLNITGTRFESFSGTSPNYPGSNNAVGVQLQNVTGVNITGCNFEMAGDQVGSTNQNAIYIYNESYGVNISGNHFSANGCLNYLIYVAANDSQGVSITSNHFYRTNIAGIGAAGTLALSQVEIGNNIAEAGSVVIVDNTFTPTVTIGGASTGITYSVQRARFTRYGKNLTYEVSIALTSKGALTGTVRIGGLPKGADSTLTPTVPNFVGSAFAQNLASSLSLVSLMASDGSQSIRLYKNDGTELQDTDITNTTSLTVSVTVQTA
jgi:hypothetical protein